MIRPFLSPRWLMGHAGLVVVVVAFVFFGRWQLAAYEDVGAAPSPASAVELDAVAKPGARLADGAVGRHVTIVGRYDAKRQLLVPAREHKDRAGFLVITPLRSESGVVAIHRGWVRSPPDSTVGLLDGEVTVTGVLQPSEGERDAQVDLLTPLPARQIPYVSTVELQEALPYTPQEMYDGYVLLAEQKPAGASAPELMTPQQPTSGSGRWRNLAYALQWWLFAGAAAFFWGTIIRRSARERRELTAATKGP